MRISGWRSDVCASDLAQRAAELAHQVAELPAELLLALRVGAVGALLTLALALLAVLLRALEAAVEQFLLLAHHVLEVPHHARGFLHILVHQIGRASCRERVWYV